MPTSTVVGTRKTRAPSECFAAVRFQLGRAANFGASEDRTVPAVLVHWRSGRYFPRKMGTNTSRLVAGASCARLLVGRTNRRREVQQLLRAPVLRSRRRRRGSRGRVRLNKSACLSAIAATCLQGPSGRCARGEEEAQAHRWAKKAHDGVSGRPCFSGWRSLSFCN